MSAVQNNSNGIHLDLSQQPKAPKRQMDYFSKLPFVLKLMILDCLKTDERTSVHALNIENSHFVERHYYGERDKATQLLCRTYVQLPKKLAQVATLIMENRKEAAEIADDPSLSATVWRMNLQIVYRALKIQHVALNAQLVCIIPAYKKAMLMNKCDRKIMDLFGSRKNFEKLPVICLDERRMKGDYIDYVRPGDLNAPMVRSVDSLGRTAISFRVLGKGWVPLPLAVTIPECSERAQKIIRDFKPRDLKLMSIPGPAPYVQTLFQRHPHYESWALGGSRIFMGSYVIEHGRFRDEDLYKELKEFIRTKPVQKYGTAYMRIVDEQIPG